MVHRLKDIVVVLTGASSGIGASIAENLLKEGAKVREREDTYNLHDNDDASELKYSVWIL